MLQVQPSVEHHQPVTEGPAEGSQGSGGHVPGAGEHGQLPLQQRGAVHVGRQGKKTSPFPPEN